MIPRCAALCERTPSVSEGWRAASGLELLTFSEWCRVCRVLLDRDRLHTLHALTLRGPNVRRARVALMHELAACRHVALWAVSVAQQ